MELHKRTLLLLLVILLPIIAIGQELKSNLFLRTPQVINYNFNQEKISYNPVVSIGLGLSYKSTFIELATFINDNDIYGFYTFFGTTLKTKELGGNLKLHTNWFGEIAYVPKQSLSSDSFTYTTGLCFFLNYSLNWGSIGLPLCVGVGYNEKTISLNTRTILNISLNLN
jgi:hypothetical protein